MARAQSFASQIRGYHRTNLALAGWIAVILAAGMLPLRNYVGHAHWEAIQWTIPAAHWHSRRFYFDLIRQHGPVPGHRCREAHLGTGALDLRRHDAHGLTAMDRIAIVGTGLIGRAWAIVFARAGHPVAGYDSDGAALAAPDTNRGPMTSRLPLPAAARSPNCPRTSPALFSLGQERLQQARSGSHCGGVPL